MIFLPFSYSYTAGTNERMKNKKRHAWIIHTDTTIYNLHISFRNLQKKKDETNLYFRMSSYIMKTLIGNEFDKVMKGELREILESEWSELFSLVL